MTDCHFEANYSFNSSSRKLHLAGAVQDRSRTTLRLILKAKHS